MEGEIIIKRTLDSNDQRRSTIVLTAKGQRVFAKVAPDSEALYAGIEEDFGNQKLEDLYELLAEFIDPVDHLTDDKELQACLTKN